MKKRYSALVAVIFPLFLGCGATEPDRTPATLTLDVTGPLSLVSGTVQVFAATVKNKAGDVLTDVAVTYATSDATVLTAQGTTGSFVAAKVGSAVMTASAGSVSAQVSVTVTPGAASKLGMKTQPGGAVSGQPLTPQPVIEVQDAAGNAVASATGSVSASIASGGGTLAGTTTATIAGGVATFGNLAIRGAAGSRTLGFTAAGLSQATSAGVTITNDPDPVAVAISPATAQTVASGATIGFTATLKNADSVALAGTITWASKSTTIAPISGSGLVTGLMVGQTKIVAKSGSLTSDSVTVTVVPGAANHLGVRTNPGGARIGSPFTTQPQVEIRDGNGNVVTSSSAQVTAAIFSGSGTLSGTTTVAAANGVATFTNLAIGGTTGDHQLRFTSGSLTSALSASFAVSNNPPTIAVSASQASFTAAQGGSAPPSQTLSVTNSGDGTLNNLQQAVTYGAEATGWLTATLSQTIAPAALVLTASPGSLAIGTYTATVTVSSSAATNQATVSVTMTVGSHPASIRYGDDNAKVVRLDISGTTTPTQTAFDGTGATMSGVTYTFTSRAPAIATVSSSGVITAVGAGSVFVVAGTPGGAADSVYVQVLPATGPVMYTDLTRIKVPLGQTLTVKVYIDMRGATLGSLHFAVNYPGPDFTGFLALGTVADGAGGIAMQTSTTATGQLSATGAASGGKTGVVELLSIQFTVDNTNRYGFISVLPLDVTALDYSSLTASVTALRYPLRVP